MIKILYIDAGSHKGEQIDFFSSAFFASKFSVPVDITIKGIEPNPDLYHPLVKKYQHCNNIDLYNFCIAQDFGSTDFYIAENTMGSSMYTGKFDRWTEHFKENIQSAIKVPAQPLSSFISSINNLEQYDVKILKANIEGGEYDMLLDLDKNNAFIFDFYIGTGDYPYAILDDFRKVTELKNKIYEAKLIMDKNNIVAHKLNGPRANEMWKNYNPDFNSEICTDKPIDPQNYKGNVNVYQIIKDCYNKKHD
jgi:FkbM family methyltransferase